jgi:hypothetical protein
MKKRINAKQFLTACLLSGLCALAAVAQAKPDFSGTWKMNSAKSKFAREGPDSITLKIEQKETGLSEVLAFGNNANERRVEAQYTNDGKESDVTMGGQTAKGSLKWEGETLVIAWKRDEGSFTRKLKLSADGKTINMEVNHPNGEAVDLVVLEKQ